MIAPDGEGCQCGDGGCACGKRRVFVGIDVALDPSLAVGVVELRQDGTLLQTLVLDDTALD